jgi:hypothetical protein
LEEEARVASLLESLNLTTEEGEFVTLAMTKMRPSVECKSGR